MATDNTQTMPTRQIGIAGTIARIVGGLALTVSVVIGHWNNFQPLPWIVGLVAFPALTLAWQKLRSRYIPARLTATGPIVHLLNIAVFLALYLTPWYAPDIGLTSDAALLFYGTSMLLAAARGYAGCEVLAISNWLLRRDDQIGCLVFGPIDAIENRRRNR